MSQISRRGLLRSSGAVLPAAALPRWSQAQGVAYGPEDLKSTLTPFGAIRAGNAEGTIPAWTGGDSSMPSGYKSGDLRPIPFADEKPLLTITSTNCAQYQSKLTKGTIALLQKYPQYKVEVFQTHRTAIAPQYVYDYIYKNATSAQLSADGNSITGAYGGIPFPIPKNGHEVLWNHELAWAGVSAKFVAEAYTVTSAGTLVQEARADGWYQYPYYFQNGEADFSGFYQQQFIVPTAPPYEAGGSILLLYPVNPAVTPVEGWTYLPGERRTRRAPELQYDTPQSLAGGITNWDEVNVFTGKLDRYDFDYTGVKEIYVPYNTNKAYNATVQEQCLPQFFNPELTRWELHRVRVVEATVKPGARNVDARRTIYCDEDTGAAVAGDVYDASGSLWKMQHIMPAIFADVPCVNASQFFITYDLHGGNYSIGDTYNASCVPQYEIIKPLPSSFFTAGQLAASAEGF